MESPVRNTSLLLDFEPKPPSDRTVHILPTTPHTLARVSEWRWEQDRLVVAPGLAGCFDSGQFLSRLARARRHDPFSAVIFTDQLVSAIDAPLLVERAETRSFYPAIELIAHVKYDLALHVWTGNSFDTLSPPSSGIEVLRLLSRYLSACDELGPQWLAREGRRHGSTAARAAQVRRRLRTFHSVVMHAFRDSALSPTGRLIAARLLAAERAVKD